MEKTRELPPALKTRIRTLTEAARATAEQAKDDREARDAVIAQADQDGYLLRQIARATADGEGKNGLSVSHVQRICIAASADRWAASNHEEYATC